MTERNRIFLGHASEDKPKVRELYHQLEAEGFSPWLDVEDLIPGQNWRIAIPKAIKSAGIFLACLSKNSTSKRGYVQREFRAALSTYAELPPESIYLIPVRLDDCAVPDLQLPELELNLRDLHWVDLFEPAGFERLTAAIKLTLLPSAPPGGLAMPSTPFEIFKSINAPWCPEMVMLPAGKFLMGAPEGEAERFDHEGPQHEVAISQPFALGRHAVTFEEYNHFCEATGRDKPGDRDWGRGRRPVINVSHDDALAYCAWLSEATGGRYQLPTEAQWEYACRAGTTTPFSFGAGITTDQANYDGNYPYAGGAKGTYRKQTVPVGSLPANSWGLHEMHGNVWEWCADTWHENYNGAPADGSAWSDRQDSRRVVRGGSWGYDAGGARSAYRYGFEPGRRHGSPSASAVPEFRSSRELESQRSIGTELGGERSRRPCRDRMRSGGRGDSSQVRQPAAGRHFHWRETGSSG